MSARRPESTSVEREIVRRAVVRLRARVMALVCAMVGGAGLFLITIWHVMRAQHQPAPDIGLLHNYFPGYSVSWAGAFLGLLYGALSGGCIGWVVSRVYNRIATGRDRR